MRYCDLMLFKQLFLFLVCDPTARRETHGGDAARGAAVRHQSCDQHQDQLGGPAGRFQPRQPDRNVHGGREERTSGAPRLGC